MEPLAAARASSIETATGESRHEARHRLGLPEDIASGAVQRDGLLQIGDRCELIVCGVGGPGAQLVELGESERRRAIRTAQRTAVLRGGLAVGAHLGGALGRSLGVAQGRTGIAGQLGVVREPRQVVPGRRGERREDGAMQLATTDRHDAALDRLPRDLVPESDRAVGRDEHAGGQARGDRLAAVLAHGLQQPRFSGGRSGRDDLERRSAGRPEMGDARQDGVSHGRRHRGVARLQDFRHVERIARRAPVELLGVEPAAFGERRHRSA